MPLSRFVVFLEFTGKSAIDGVRKHGSESLRETIPATAITDDTD